MKNERNADAHEAGADVCVADEDNEDDEAVDATADPNSVFHHDARSVVPNERRAICLSAMARSVLVRVGSCWFVVVTDRFSS